MLTITCNRCGAEGPIVARFCPNCGQAMTGRSTTRSCSRCGAKNPASARYCRSCGQQTSGDWTFTTTQYQTSTSTSTSWHDFPTGLFERLESFAPRAWQRVKSVTPISVRMTTPGIKSALPLSVEPSASEASARPPNGLASSSLAFGVLSLVTLCLGPLSVPFAIAAVVCGLQGVAKARRGARHKDRAVTGLTCGIVSLSAFLLFLSSILDRQSW
jgi:ribosomal protein L40E